MKSSGYISLTGNQIKILALIFMTCDHIGFYLMDAGSVSYEILRVIGRLALPLFAYMIAEGCRYTKNKKRHFFSIAGLALLCQLVFWFAEGSLYQSILVTFSLSVAVIYLLELWNERRGFFFLLPLCAVMVVAIFGFFPQQVIPKSDFAIDYGFFGVMLPVAVYLAKGKWSRIMAAAFVLILLAAEFGGRQWYSLLALLLLALYNGKKGTWNLKYLFYVYYPLHLVVIYGIGFLL